MNWCSYNSTPALDRFPVEKRYQVWRDAHKELMRSDPEYRGAVKRFYSRIIVTSLLTTVVILAFSFSSLLVAHNAVLLAIFIVVPLGLVVVDLYFVLRASFRMQHFMNQKVGRVLDSR